VTTATTSESSLPDPLEIESLMLNIDASLRVHARHQFFTWTQGLLQNLLKHELLICALRNGEPLLFHADSFAVAPVEPGPFGEMFHRDTSLVPHLVKTWEENYFKPVLCEIGSGSQFAQTPLARELTRIGTSSVLAHGTYDVFGKVATFSRSPADQRWRVPGRRILPRSLYRSCIWRGCALRSVVRREGTGATPGVSTLLTQREQEILGWIHMGKSNIEIGRSWASVR